MMPSKIRTKYFRTVEREMFRGNHRPDMLFTQLHYTLPGTVLCYRRKENNLDRIFHFDKQDTTLPGTLLVSANAYGINGIMDIINVRKYDTNNRVGFRKVRYLFFFKCIPYRTVPVFNSL